MLLDRVIVSNANFYFPIASRLWTEFRLHNTMHWFFEGKCHFLSRHHQTSSTRKVGEYCLYHGSLLLDSVLYFPCQHRFPLSLATSGAFAHGVTIGFR